jgi:tRNA-specific 2-thiouridylase
MVGMSGGVDSSVAASLLLEQGYRVAGLFMKNWDEDDGSEYCTARADLADAESVCRLLGITLHTANFAAEYWDQVFEYFLAEYRAGRTPNPDVLCNREIKFKVFAEYARALGAELIATGHYARTGSLDNGDKTLLKAVDAAKDQSYFLHAISAAQLAPCLFPLGELEKPRVRELAAAYGFRTHDKKDSTGICFIGERRFSDFLRRYLPAIPGPIESVDGEQLGEHTGLMYYTIGQRQGLGIGGLRDHDESPWYVVDKRLDDRVLLVAQGSDHPRLFNSGLRTAAPHWINTPPGPWPQSLQAKIRYRQVDQDCQLECEADGRLRVAFETPQRAVTPGQYIVFYDGNRCLGGAVIEERLS